MKISEIKAAIQAKANASNIVPTAQVTPPVQNVPTNPAPAQSKVVKSTTKKTAATPVNQTLPSPVSPSQAVPIQQTKSKTTKAKTTPISNNEDIEAIVAKYLRPGVDYAVIPHTTKPSLLKGSAERLAFIFGFRVSCEIVN